MARPRTRNLDLKPIRRLYLRRGTWFYAHPHGVWENLGQDQKAAEAKAQHYNDPNGQYGTMAWHLDEFLIWFEKQVQAGKRSQRTLDDYRENVVPLKVFFGAMHPSAIEPEHITDYLDIGASAGRAVRANREKACLSSCLSYLISRGRIPKQANPCLKEFGVRRNPETPRERYVTDAELAAVRNVAPRAVAALLELTYRTLQRPTDIITWTGEIIHAEPDGSRVLRFQQHKTKRTLSIAITGPLAQALLRAKAGGGAHFVSTGKGEAYTYDGLSSMLRRACAKAKVPSFGFRDMKAKGATDMWLSGVPLEQIQALCGHESITTTEIYVKQHWTPTVQPNQLTG